MKRRISVLLAVALLASLAGCFDKHEPKDLAILSSVVYHRNEDGSYRAIAEFMKLQADSSVSGGNSNGAKSYILEQGEGVTIREALADLEHTVERKFYGGHNQARVFTESFARQDMAAALDFFMRDPLADETPLMIVVRDIEMESIFDASHPLSDSFGMYMANMDHIQHNSTSMAVCATTLEFIRAFNTQGIEPVVGLIGLKPSRTKGMAVGQSSQNAEPGQEKQERSLVFEGLAAFKGTKLVGFFNGGETRVYNLLVGRLTKAYIAIAAEWGREQFEITKPSCDIKTNIDNGHATIDISVKIDLQLLMEGGGLSVGLVGTQEELEKRVDEQFRAEMLLAIAKAQKEFNSDIFGFGTYVHSQHPDQWKGIRDEWNDLFSEATVIVTVKSDLKQLGRISKPLLERRLK
jgi:spore germination protein KC